MTDQVKDKIAKVLELVKRGEGGEKLSAENALKRLMKKYNIQEHQLDTIKLRLYRFKYSSMIEINLFSQIVTYFLADKNVRIYKDTYYCKELVLELEYLDWITVETAWGYFRPHMNKEWRKFSKGKLNRFRKQANKNKRRQELYDAFFSSYIIKSGIYHKEQVNKREKISDKQLRDLVEAQGIEGGEYKKQVDRGLYLGNS